MKKHFKILMWSGMALALVNIVWNIICFLAYQHTLSPQLSKIMMLKIFVFGILFSAFTHLLLFSVAIIHLRQSRKYFTGGLVFIATGIVSFILLFFLWAGVHDYLVDNSEKLTGIYYIQVFHMLFYVMSITYFFLLSRISDSNHAYPGIRNEQLFIIMNITGIVCSISGIVMIRLLYHFYGGRLHPSDITPFIFILIPWVMIFTVWIYNFLLDKHSGRYDEKLATDINKTGMVVLLISVLLISVMAVQSFLGTKIYRNYFIDGRMDILWLPLYTFIALLLFSIIAIYNFRHN